MTELQFERSGTMPVTVYYEDTDFTGFVYHANYLKFFERAREELIGIETLRDLYEKQIHFVVGHIDIRYKAPAHHGDRLIVITALKTSSSPRVEFIQKCYRAEDDEPKDLLVEATVTCVTIGDNGRPRRMDNQIIDLLRQ